MTSIYEHERMQRQIEDAARAGLRIVPYRDGRAAVVPDAAMWPGIAENVKVHSAESVEEALAFVRGALWCGEFMRLSGALKKP